MLLAVQGWVKGPSGTFTSSSVFRPVLIKISAPVPPLCCIMTSSSVMMQSLGAGRQARAVEADWSGPPIICHLLRGAVRVCCGECTRAFKKIYYINAAQHFRYVTTFSYRASNGISYYLEHKGMFSFPCISSLILFNISKQICTNRRALPHHVSPQELVSTWQQISGE